MGCIVPCLVGDFRKRKVPLFSDHGMHLPWRDRADRSKRVEAVRLDSGNEVFKSENEQPRWLPSVALPG